MRIIIALLSISKLQTDFSHIKECENQYNLISTSDSIPVLKLDYSEQLNIECKE